nr:profilin-like [Lytechinus pictus]
MSWDSYIDNLVAQTKDASGTAHCDKACIIGLDGGAQWTTHEHANAYKISPSEGASIAKCFKSKDFTPFMASGVFGDGVKYQFLREEDKKVVFAKKKDHGAITMQASKTAIVLGHCPEGAQQGNLNKGVGVIAEYLEGLGM